MVTCYGGSAINSINSFVPGSTIITFVGDLEDYLPAIYTEIKTKPQVIKESNPFIKFAHYLMLNPSTNKIAIKPNSSSKILPLQ